jgi:outer membrane biosynthesis protein TonB
MSGRFFVVLGLALIYPSITLGADPVVVAPPAERAETTTPPVAPPAQIVIEKPKPVEKPKPPEKPKPVEKPRPTIVKDVPPPNVVPSKPIEPPAPAAVPAPAPDKTGAAKQGETTACYSFGCLVLAFAMLIIGVAIGFLWRHLISRHKLGGMSVRIGTWRGIP